MDKKAEDIILTSKEAAEMLGISRATVANWIKLGKLSGKKEGERYILPLSAVQKAKRSLSSSSLLQSRRNKSLSEKNFIPKSYINTKSPTYNLIKKLISYIMLEDPAITVADLITFYALKMLDHSGVDPDIYKKLIYDLIPVKRASFGTDAEYEAEIDQHIIIIKEWEDTLNEFPLSYIDGEDTLGMLYISLRRLRDKKSKGAYYTPFYAVDTCLDELKDTSLKTSAILDPACGSGNFLIRLPKDVPLKNIYGCDIDHISVCIARINLALKYRLRSSENADILMNNLRAMDFLTDDTAGKRAGFKPFSPKNGFDIIVGNPPWGYSYSSSDIKKLKKNFPSISTSTRPESFALFIEKGLSVLKENGMLTFLLPETILGSDMYLSIRKKILENSRVTGISYLGDIFDKVQCPCVILSMVKKRKDLAAPKNDKAISISFYKRMAGITQTDSFEASSDRLSESSFHILCDNEDYELINKIESSAHFTLKDKAEFALGIVTGNNKDLLISEHKRGYEPIAKGSDIEPYVISSPASYIKFDPDSFQQCADKYYYRAKERLLYRFISRGPIFAYDDTGLLTLNSANILIPKVKGYSTLYILCVLNSPVISYYYRYSFKNMKVLRSAIEALPIPKCDRKTMDEITGLAKELLISIKNDDPEKDLSSLSLPIIYEINKKIAYLYGLSPEEYVYICENAGNKIIYKN
ncbi:MAG: N-6 DNA methylase [Butyrivibrio sp.]|nr:N-6 DNA methylase [Butyrivibrio sp.]